MTNKRKYRNRKTEHDGIIFDSQLERDYYLVLKEKAKAGEIKSFSLQPEFELIPSFRKDGKTFRKTIYKADFKVILNDGTEEILDVKGVETDVFKIKRKLLELQNPFINFYLIKRKHGKWEKLR